MTGVLIASNFIENALITYGIINPVIGGFGVPIVSAMLIVAILWLFKKYAKAEVAV